MLTVFAGSTGKVTMDSNKLMETDAYCYFIYNKELVFGAKYTVRVRLANEDFVQMRKVIGNDT